jgi:alkylated DNA repair dioxygenase AlkB
MAEVIWREEEIVLFGHARPVPRLVAWSGDAGVCYRYSNQDHVATGWPDLLADIRDRVAAELPVEPNFVLLNRYRSGNDSMGWHTDDEPMASDLLGSLSLGAERRFLLRPSGSSPSQGIDLAHGSLLIFDRHLPHCLPKTRRDCAERINLSFRTVV